MTTNRINGELLRQHYIFLNLFLQKNDDSISRRYLPIRLFSG